MRILVDYRPALRQRTGVGEYIHQLTRAYAAAHDDEIALFTSSWKDRPAPEATSQVRAAVVDRRIPVRALNLLWHRWGWPPVESIAGEYDVVHAAHPLLIPARRAAQVITVHDLFFMSDPQRTRAEIRRDYAALAPDHARRADAIVTSTRHGKQLVVNRLGAPEDRVYVCPAGAPTWRTLGVKPNVPPNGYVLFLGTLEPRKNVGVLLDAYALLLERGRPVPPLVLAGRATADTADWLARIDRAPLAGRVRHVGYVGDDQREPLYAGARALVLPSLDEGFGLPALEAMSAGVPLIASNRGSLPEVVGGGGVLVSATEPDALAAAIEAIVHDDDEAIRLGRAGIERAREFAWTESARTLRRAYTDAVARRRIRAHRD